MQFSGVLEVDDKVTAAASGQYDSELGDSYSRVQPRFETGDTRYTWLNRRVGLVEGRVGRNEVWYRAFRAIQGWRGPDRAHQSVRPCTGRVLLPCYHTHG